MLSLAAATTGKRMRGHTLSELLIAAAIGLFILAGIAFMYAEFARANHRLLGEAQLRQALAAAGALVGGELRRAGYWSRARDTLGGNAVNGYAPLRIVDGDCILYSYDKDRASADGRPREEDRFGLRLADGALQLKTSDAHCDAADCASCASGTWWAMTDPQQLTVTGFSLHEERRVHDSGTGAIAVRSIRFTLAGELKRDPSIRHAIASLVNVRNDEIL
jgi:type II secretory pathway component PulJ